MTAAQTKAARRRMKNDDRYQYRTTAETSQRRNMHADEKRKTMMARKAKLK